VSVEAFEEEAGEAPSETPGEASEGPGESSQQDADEPMQVSDPRLNPKCEILQFGPQLIKKIQTRMGTR